MSFILKLTYNFLVIIFLAIKYSSLNVPDEGLYRKTQCTHDIYYVFLSFKNNIEKDDNATCMTVTETYLKLNLRFVSRGSTIRVET